MLTAIARRVARINPLAWFALAYAAMATLQKGLGFVLFLWLAQSLTVDDYATFGLLYAVQTGLAAFAASGIGEAVIGHLREYRDGVARGQLYGAANALYLRLAAFGTLAAALIYAIWLFGEHAGSLVFACIAISGSLAAFLTIQAKLVRLEEHHSSAIFIGFIGPLTGYAVAFVAFAVWRGVDAVFIGMAVGLVAICLVFRLLGLGHFKFTSTRAVSASLRASTPPYVAVVALSWVGGYGSTFFVDSLFAASDVAKFAFAYTLASILQLAASSMNQVWSPRFFKLAHELPIEELERRSERFYSFQGVVLGGIGAAVLLALPFGIGLVGGNLTEYRDVGPGLLLLFAGYAMTIPSWHAQNYFFVHGQGKALMSTVAMTTALGTMVWLGLMIYAGPLGIYAGFLVQMAIRTGGVWIAARRRWDIRLMWCGPAAALALLVAGLWLARYEFGAVAGVRGVFPTMS